MNPLFVCSKKNVKGVEWFKPNSLRETYPNKITRFKEYNLHGKLQPSVIKVGKGRLSGALRLFYHTKFIVVWQAVG